MSRNVTLSSLKTQVQQRTDQEVAGPVADAELTGLINQSYAELVDLLVSQDEEYYISSYDVTTAAGTTSYSLPADFYKLKGVDIREASGSGQFTQARPFQWNERNLLSNAVLTPALNGPPCYYSMRGSNLILNPAPDGQRTVRIWYVPCATTLVSGSDTVDGVNGFEEYIVVDAAIKCLIKEEKDISALVMQKKDLLKRIERMAGSRNIDESHKTIDRTTSEYWFYE